MSPLDLRRSSLVNDRALIDDGHVVGERVVPPANSGSSAAQSCRAPPSCEFHPTTCAALPRRAQRWARQEKQVWISANGKREEHALPLAAGEIAELAIAQFL